MDYWEVDEKDKDRVYLTLDEDNTIHIRRTDEGVFFEVWSEGLKQFTFSQAYENEDLIVTAKCSRCDKVDYDDAGLECLGCGEWFCDNCYDTDLGDGCYCHNEFYMACRKNSRERENE